MATMPLLYRIENALDRLFGIPIAHSLPVPLADEPAAPERKPRPPSKLPPIAEDKLINKEIDNIQIDKHIRPPSASTPKFTDIGEVANVKTVNDQQALDQRIVNDIPGAGAFFNVVGIDIGGVHPNAAGLSPQQLAYVTNPDGSTNLGKLLVVEGRTGEKQLQTETAPSPVAQELGLVPIADDSRYTTIGGGHKTPKGED